MISSCDVAIYYRLLIYSVLVVWSFLPDVDNTWCSSSQKIIDNYSCAMWVGSSVSCYFWVGSGWVTSLVGRVGSGQENLTHVQLCHTCIRWSFHYHSIRLAAERYTTIIELARVRHPARYICFLYNAITGRLLLPAIPMLTRRLIELGCVTCWRTIRQTQ